MGNLRRVKKQLMEAAEIKTKDVNKDSTIWRFILSSCKPKKIKLPHLKLRPKKGRLICY